MPNGIVKTNNKSQFLKALEQGSPKVESNMLYNPVRNDYLYNIAQKSASVNVFANSTNQEASFLPPLLSLDLKKSMSN